MWCVTEFGIIPAEVSASASFLPSVFVLLTSESSPESDSLPSAEFFLSLFFFSFVLLSALSAVLLAFLPSLLVFPFFSFLGEAGYHEAHVELPGYLPLHSDLFEHCYMSSQN